MRNMRLLLTRWSARLIPLMLLVINVQASAQICTPRTDNTHFIFVNGVWNTAGQAQVSADLLEDALAVPGQARVDIVPFWNPGDGKVNDGLEAIVAQQWGSPASAFVAGVLVLANPWLQSEIIQQRENANARHRRTVEQFKSRLIAALSDGGKVVIVAHSQGNLVVGDALRDLVKSGVNIGSVGVVSLASPDTNEPATHGLHTTTSKDFIRGVPGRLETNFDAVTGDIGLLAGHTFADGYLNSSVADQSGQSIRSKVVESIRRVRDSVESCGLQLVLAPPSTTVKIGETYQFSVVATNAGRNNASAPRPEISIVPNPSLFEVTSISGVQGVSTFTLRGIAVGTFNFVVRNDVDKKEITGQLTVTPTAEPPPIEQPQHPPAWEATFKITKCDAVRGYGSGSVCNAHGGHGFGSWTTGFFWLADSAGRPNNMVYSWQINDGTFTSYEYKSVPFDNNNTTEFDIPVRHLLPDFPAQYRENEQSPYTVKTWPGYDEINNLRFVITSRTATSLAGTFAGANTYYRYQDSQLASIFGHLEKSRANISGTWTARRTNLPLIAGASSDGCGYISVLNQWVAYRLVATGLVATDGPACTVTMGPR